MPRYDRWFDKVFTKEWGEKNRTDVIVDHIAATEVPARAAAEAAAGKGHDLFHFLSPPAAYDRNVLDHADVVREVERRVFNTFVIPTTFARVARDETTPEGAVKAAHAEIARIFGKWAS